MERRATPRNWIRAAVMVQVAGLAYDAVWHGLLNPGFEARTVEEMVTHLATVHLPLYVGVVAVFLSTAWALIDWTRRGRPGAAVPVAFAGAALSLAGEAWHAYTHLQLSIASAPIAAATSLVGLAVVVGALWLSGRRGRPEGARDVDERRAA